MAQHILHAFEDSLLKLRKDILTMANLSEQALQQSVQALFERNIDLANKVIVDDEEVDKLEKQVDRDGLEVIVKFSPMAKDLRRVLSAVKVGQQLERVADECVNIAKRAKSISGHPALPETTMVQNIYDLAANMLRASIQAFINGDLRLALALEERDEELDLKHKEFIGGLVKRCKEDAANLEDYLDLMTIVRSLERVGDHAVNIAEDIVYAESAYDIRHGGERPQL
jgi:phosphate transport system protein